MSNKTIIGIIMTAILTLGFLLTSCRHDPKDGIYQPKKHISNIIIGSNFSDTSAMQEWHWSDNLLRTIDFFSKPDHVLSLASTEHFFYENDRLTHIEMDKIKSEFTYDGDKLSQVVMTVLGEESMRFKLAYEKSKLSTITVSGLFDKKRQDLLAPLCRFMSQPIWLSLQHCSNMLARNTKDNDQIVIHLEWDGKNVSKAWTTGDDETLSFSFTYDKKINPFDGFFHCSFIINPYSIERPHLRNRNNVLTMTATYAENSSLAAESETYRFEYTYDGDYPTSVTYPKSLTKSSSVVERYQYE